MYRTKDSYYSHHYEIVHDLSKYVSSTELSATRTKVAGSNKPEDVGDDFNQSIKELERRTKKLFDWVRTSFLGNKWQFTARLAVNFVDYLFFYSTLLASAYRAGANFFFYGCA